MIATEDLVAWTLSDHRGYYHLESFKMWRTYPSPGCVCCTRLVRLFKPLFQLHQLLYDL